MSLDAHSKQWLSHVALTSLFLVASLPVMTQASQLTAMPKQPLRSAQISSGTYSIVIHKDLKWTQENAPISKPVELKQSSDAVVALTNAAVSEQKEIPVQKQVQAQQPVKIAAVPSTSASRGSSGDTGVVSRALSLEGIPYVFGGNSRSGFDCSGFTKYVFSASGINLPRTSYGQFETGTSIARSELQPGDLVFFSTYSKGASHVGIYIGSGRFVHASDSGVRTTSLSDSYYASRYLGARRVQ